MLAKPTNVGTGRMFLAGSIGARGRQPRIQGVVEGIEWLRSLPRKPSARARKRCFIARGSIDMAFVDDR